MKRLLTIVLLLLATVGLKAQVFLIDTFKLSAAEGAFGIYADYDCTSSNEFYLDMQANYDSERVQMKLEKIDDFVFSLRGAQKVFEVWSKMAHDNGATSVAKDILVPFYDEEMYYTVGGVWYKKGRVGLRCRFLVADDGTCYMALLSDNIESDEVVASHGYSKGNSFNNLAGKWTAEKKTSINGISDGVFLVFSSSEEIEMFIDKLYKAKSWKSKNIEQGKLFK